MKMRILSTLSRRKILTAPTAPLSLASVKMSTSCDACVALASHETSATQDVVAAFGTLGQNCSGSNPGRAPVKQRSNQLTSIIRRIPRVFF